MNQSRDNPARQALYESIRPHHMTPLWEVLHALVPRSPTTACVPALWRYREVKPFLMQSGELITAEEAVRRVLILENPGLPGQSAITQSLYAGLQLMSHATLCPTAKHIQACQSHHFT